jgi:hypothetical protein
MWVKMLSRRKILISLIVSSILPVSAMASGGGGHGGAKPAESDFILPSQITGTIMNGLRPQGLMQVDVGIYTKDSNLKALLPQMRPILVANWRAALQEYLNRYYRPGQVPDANLLASLMQKSIQKQIGQSQARVIIQAIIAR